jgi:transposase
MSKKQNIEHDPIADRQAVRMYVRLRDDFQAMRKRMDNRIGRKADGTDQDIDERHFSISDLANFTSIADAAREQEDVITKMMLQTLRRFPVYREYLKDAKGVGPIAAGWIVGEIDIHIADTVSKMWQFCGLNPGMVRGLQWGRGLMTAETFFVPLSDAEVDGFNGAAV